MKDVRTARKPAMRWTLACERQPIARRDLPAVNDRNLQVRPRFFNRFDADDIAADFAAVRRDDSIMGKPPYGHRVLPHIAPFAARGPCRAAGIGRAKQE
ncbi:MULTISPECIES: hypothetical protein [unclassified Burkholderia]|uniref:hypothetical protein n=1 Tax=unclassified Burkholderia TaxID=2613784 RepID=UPI000759B93F|nr:MULTISPECIES: hypothetical protein [unclassified Burkholderia]KUZ00692.1 hypothetical protein WS48_06305 [Burkholderia sp. RF7-non_BP1]KUZ04468.1 hypothetical protein WS49_08855 [Burkholderia sp. RF7-non_BP4]